MGREGLCEPRGELGRRHIASEVGVNQSGTASETASLLAEFLSNSNRYFRYSGRE